jgi:Chaperone of endosialidase
MKTTGFPLKHSMNRSSRTFALRLIPLALAYFALVPQTRAVCQEGCLTNLNTVLGEDALLNNAGTGNTAIGFNTLRFNTTASENTANGEDALFSNTTGSDNTANGVSAVFFNTTGFANTATGAYALQSNTTGDDNTANGVGALQNNTTGSGNIALGDSAGINLTTGNNNIDIGSRGFFGEDKTIRIGVQGTQTQTFIAGISGTPLGSGVPVGVNVNGQLGVKPSSVRYKEAIQPMDKASEGILALKPVTFRYKHELDPEGIPQYGLVAEEVEKVNPDLVVRDDQGKPFTVRYEEVNAMLLNEFLKEHRKNEQQRKDFEAALAQQRKQIEALTAGLQKVSTEPMSSPVNAGGK